MTFRVATLVLLACLCPAPASPQTAPPNLTRQQRQLLQSLVAAVDADRSEPIADDRWLLHVLRASDGSHYVAMSLAPDAPLPVTPIVVYVRLATAATPGSVASAERSMVREWLQGSRVDPRLLPRRGGVAIGDMPPMGAGAIGVRGGSSVGSTDLQLIDLERRRSRERREDEEKKRRATLEGTLVSESDRLPFEDFDVAAAAVLPDGARAIRRALTAGPGGYDLYVAWVDASLPAAKAPVHVARRSLQLAPAAAEFGLSSLIVADRIGIRTTPFNSLEQRAHPYSIGPTDIEPARDVRFTPAERLSVAFQIFNAAATAGGKPDVVINPRIARVAGMREEVVASLTPLTYDAASMPEDFDLRLGHPIIAALAAPLSTLRRGDYKLVVTAEDRQAGAVASTATPFTIVSTPAGLLAEAPPLAQRLTPGMMIAPASVGRLLDGLAVANPSPAMARALDAARAGRYADLLIEDPVAESERAARAALTGLALLSVGDLGATAQFQRAALLGGPQGPVQYLLGAGLSLQRRDADAIAAWNAATTAGVARAITAPLVAHTWMLRGDAAAAAASLSAGDVAPTDAAAVRTFAATRIATQREREAIAALDPLLADHAGDLEARWLLVRALYAELVRGSGDRARFLMEAQRYVDAGGPHAALARDWMSTAF